MKIMVFRPPFGLNDEYGGSLKGGIPPLMGVHLQEVQPLAAHVNCGFTEVVSEPAHVLWWVLGAFPLL